MKILAAPFRRRSVLRMLAGLVGCGGSFRWAAPAAQTLDQVLQETFGTSRFTPSDLIELKIAALAEDGTVVPVHIACKLPDVESITIVADNNPVPIIARFRLQAPLLPTLSTRIKLAADTEVRAIVTTKAGIYASSRHVRVVQGGCDLAPVGSRRGE